MQIELKEISIRELTDRYQDNAENGVTAYHGELDVRPLTNVSLYTVKRNEMRLFIQSSKAFL